MRCGSRTLASQATDQQRSISLERTSTLRLRAHIRHTRVYVLCGNERRHRPTRYFALGSLINVADKFHSCAIYIYKCTVFISHLHIFLSGKRRVDWCGVETRSLQIPTPRTLAQMSPLSQHSCLVSCPLADRTNVELRMRSCMSTIATTANLVVMMLYAARNCCHLLCREVSPLPRLDDELPTPRWLPFDSLSHLVFNAFAVRPVPRAFA